MRLQEATWPQVAARAGRSLLVIPVGSTEQHGPHLPTGTDTLVAEALAQRLARTRPDAVVAPSLGYGASGEHAGFAGTLSIGTEVLRCVLVELVRSADAFAATVIVNGHGGNLDAVGAAVEQLDREGRRIMAWHPSTTVTLAAGGAGDAHAGRDETSLVLALAPALVAADQASAGSTQPLAEMAARLRSDGVQALSPNGVLGDPAGATPAEGESLLDALAADLIAAVAAW